MSSLDLGEWSEMLPAIQEVADKVKSQLEKKVGKPYPVFVAKEFRNMVLCGGTHFLIKVSVSNTTDECVHLQVVQIITATPVEPELKSYQLNKTRQDPLEPF